jgi:hypothetical protein
MMAEIVLGIASSHGPMLGSPATDFLKHADRDIHNKAHLDRDGVSILYEDMLKLADPAIAEELTPGAVEAKAAGCQAGIARLAEALSEAKPDVVVIVGDDQKEQFFEDNLPAMLIYSGATIENNVSPLPKTAPEYWKRARSQFHEDDGVRAYPVAGELARHFTASLVEAGFDISHSEKLPRARGEGHAFGFVHKRLMGDRQIPIVPVVLNTYYPPNQPTPRRCFAFGRALADAVRTWPDDIRVVFVASGGMSHFTINQELDRSVMEAFLACDGDKLGAIPRVQLNSGNSEIRNWIVVAGATIGLSPQWHDYIPCYRTPAGTGCGMGFAILGNGQ